MASAAGAAVREAGRARGQRDDAMVTARVDRGLKSRGMAVLKELGSTPTELVNRAFEYAAETGELPAPPSATGGGAGVRRVTAAMRQRMEEFVEATTFALPEGALHGDYRTLVEEAAREKYESLA